MVGWDCTLLSRTPAAYISARGGLGMCSERCAPEAAGVRLQVLSRELHNTQLQHTCMAGCTVSGHVQTAMALGTHAVDFQSAGVPHAGRSCMQMHFAPHGLTLSHPGTHPAFIGSVTTFRMHPEFQGHPHCDGPERGSCSAVGAVLTIKQTFLEGSTVQYITTKPAE